MNSCRCFCPLAQLSPPKSSWTGQLTRASASVCYCLTSTLLFYPVSSKETLWMLTSYFFSFLLSLFLELELWWIWRCTSPLLFRSCQTVKSSINPLLPNPDQGHRLERNMPDKLKKYFKFRQIVMQKPSSELLILLCVLSVCACKGLWVCVCVGVAVCALMGWPELASWWQLCFGLQGECAEYMVATVAMMQSITAHVLVSVWQLCDLETWSCRVSINIIVLLPQYLSIPPSPPPAEADIHTMELLSHLALMSTNTKTLRGLRKVWAGRNVGGGEGKGQLWISICFLFREP